MDLVAALAPPLVVAVAFVAVVRAALRYADDPTALHEPPEDEPLPPPDEPSAPYTS